MLFTANVNKMSEMALSPYLNVVLSKYDIYEYLGLKPVFKFCNKCL